MDRGLNFRFILAKRGNSVVWQLRGERMQLLIESAERYPSQSQAKKAAEDFYAEVGNATFDFSDPDE